MIICIGDSYLELCGCPQTVTFLKCIFKDYLVEDKNLQTENVISYEGPIMSADELFSGETGNNGWVDASVVLNGQKKVLYVSENAVLFALQYNSRAKHIEVFTAKHNPASVRLSTQFALMIALHEHYVGLHGVTVLCGDKVVILSAPSGTGKTTLAKLLEEYSDAIVINGDFALLTIHENDVVFEPTPFCGSSGRCIKRCVRVDHIVFLEQAAVNKWKVLNGREAVLHLMKNAFVPTWDGALSTAVQDSTLKIASRVRVSHFSFAPFQEAAEMLKYQVSQKL